MAVGKEERGDKRKREEKKGKQKKIVGSSNSFVRFRIELEEKKDFIFFLSRQFYPCIIFFYIFY